MSDTSADNTPLPWGSGPYSIRRHGTTLTTCDSEPVQTPGCIQAHGALLVARIDDLTILQASENTGQHLGEPPEQLLGQPVARVVGATNAACLRAMLEREPLVGSARYAFTLPARDGASPLDVCVHTVEDALVLEFERTGRAANHVDGDFFMLVTSAVNRLQAADGLREFCQRVADEVRRITGLDRVMVYRFHADNHGEVFAENKRDDLPPWLGLHYPESDIPRPAREIYKRLWIRPLPNAAGPLVELVPLANPDSGRPLNMTHCALRGASGMYTEYLANMRVAASLTMPILVDGELWGLIACHHLVAVHFPHQVRAACELLAQVASLQLKSAERNEQLAYRLKLERVHQQLVALAAQEGDLMALSDRHPSLLDGIDAGGAALYHLDRWCCVGRTPSVAQLDALAAWLDKRPEFASTTRPLFVTDSLAREYPARTEIAEMASGVLAVRVSHRRRDLILWFRPETLQTINWAGYPHDKLLVAGPHGSRLTPRHSFDLFVESVRARSLPWSSVEVDAALRLRFLLMEVVIARAERLAELNVDLTSSNEELDAFAYVASHDLKEPLRGINRYAHQLLESAQALDTENRQHVDSLMRLTVRMDSLLDSLLHFSRVGRTTLEFETVDLNEVVAEALEMIGVRRTENTCSIELPRRLPTIDSDHVRVREIFSNLLSNALKYNRQACPRIEVGYLAPGEPGARPNAPAEAQEHTIYYVRDDGIGIERRHFDQIYRMFKRLHGRDAFGGGVGAGLTIVQKLVHRHGGHIWLDSSEGVGSTFYFTLPFPNEVRQGDGRDALREIKLDDQLHVLPIVVLSAR
ncbi:MAG: GAF domain-containing protein [Candidatus Accumulibacter phosphatis]|uniref:ATP-binding protein n=1 Tax=Candidatus Accumulibacter phosphatis TaxID=327160 RepID=UPI001A60E373|nr:GAF domain-containing protein [Candidatus Accumulibacter phosphatis]